MKEIESLIRTSPIPVSIFNKINREMLLSSTLMEKKLGYSHEELASFSKDEFLGITHPEDHVTSAKIKDQLENSKDGEVVEAILRLKHRDGNYLSFHMYCSVIDRDDDDNMQTCAVYANDLTEQLNIQKELRNSLNKIEEMTFVNSHDLRAPVANIIGIVNMLKSSEFIFEHQKSLIHLLIDTVNQLDGVIRYVNDVASRD